MKVSSSPKPPAEVDADTVAIGIFEGASAPAELPAAAAELIASGEARGSVKALALAHADGRRWLLVGLGKREQWTPERARVAAANAAARVRELSTSKLCWALPDEGDERVAEALVEGTVLSSYRFDQFKSAREEAEEAGELSELTIACPPELDAAVARAALTATRVNRARDLQNRPGNDLTPTSLGEYARRLAEEIPGLTASVEGRDGLRERGMGAFSAVAQGSAQEPALITLRYDGPGAGGPTLCFVGKAVTFDSGGISLKPGPKMAEMKFDMSGGAAAIEATAAIALLELPVKLLTVVGATENMPSGSAIKPGDIVKAANGRTIEINNTDAEGRLVLADCLCHAVAEGAERIVDLATLTGAVIIALGSTYAGVMSNDDELFGRIEAAGAETGEIVWRLPLHEEYDALLKGSYADLDNAPEARKAGTIVGGAFLSNFVGDVPWAHVDIAGSAWDLGRAYVGKGASGYGVRMLVELARGFAG
jgi:leucyl aminopeptidase